MRSEYDDIWNDLFDRLYEWLCYVEAGETRRRARWAAAGRYRRKGVRDQAVRR